MVTDRQVAIVHGLADDYPSLRLWASKWYDPSIVSVRFAPDDEALAAAVAVACDVLMAPVHRLFCSGGEWVAVFDPGNGNFAKHSGKTAVEAVLDVLVKNPHASWRPENRRTPDLVVVGELNPYSVDVRFALHHLPARASGDRLRGIMGLSPRGYYSLRRVNLCTGTFSAPAAREEARHYAGEKVVVMLGRKVAAAFGRDGQLPFSAEKADDGTTYVSLPHPSGLCREWNTPGAVQRARDVLSSAAPWVPWGKHGA